MTVDRESPELGDWLERFFKLEASGWKGKEGTAISCDPKQEQFYREVIHEANRRGRLMLSNMLLDGKLISSQLNVLGTGGAGFSLKVAYNEDYAKRSPGMVLDLEVVEIAHQRQYFDWIDSCCAPGSNSLRAIWQGRRTIGSLVVPTRPLGGDLLLSTLPLARFVKRRIRPRRNPAR